MKLSRRDFLKSLGALGASLLVRKEPAPEPEPEPESPFVQAGREVAEEWIAGFEEDAIWTLDYAANDDAYTAPCTFSPCSIWVPDSFDPSRGGVFFVSEDGSITADGLTPEGSLPTIASALERCDFYPATIVVHFGHCEDV